VFGYVALCRLILPRLEQRGGGVIVNVIGGAAVRPRPNYIAGAAGNAALAGLTQALGSTSLRAGVRVVGVNPGLIATDRMTDLLKVQARERWGDPERWPEMLHPDRPPGRPEHIADVVAFLASPRAGHVSGAVLTVDGGQTLQ
jgi:NAD(P)-dependent dehydrogenase (short-subunit alcohol dehydrogenase family)